MSGSEPDIPIVILAGEKTAAIVEAAAEVERLLGEPPVIVGGIAVLSRLTTAHRATSDLDVVDRRHGDALQLEILRAAPGAEVEEPAAVLLPTKYGAVKVDVIEVRQIELDEPSDNPGDRLHAASHAWAHDTASAVTLQVQRPREDSAEVTARMAEPGPLVAMKLQAIEDRGADKQGTDLLDVVRLVTDPVAGPVARRQIKECADDMAADIDWHVARWFDQQRPNTLRWIRATGNADVEEDDLSLVSELLHEMTSRN